MNEITVKNFRCFRAQQTARLAPLTLLVGENSTGKTSFMAMIRVLWDLAYRFRNPDFKEDPYDLGSFDEIVHRSSARHSQANSFEAGFVAGATEQSQVLYQFSFEKRGTTPVAVKSVIAQEDAWISESQAPAGAYTLRVGSNGGSWEVRTRIARSDALARAESDVSFPGFYHALGSEALADQFYLDDFLSLDEGPPFTTDDLIKVRQLAQIQMSLRQPIGFPGRRPFASAPVRSKPRRTYDPSRPTPNPEGDFIPMYLADVYAQDKDTWTTLKQRLENFGRSAELFNEISIRQFGRQGSEPFQVQIKKFDGRLKGPARNLIDMGYGVSQVLPIVTELLREGASPLFLLQQPEVHLHPKAQAALGSLFCEIASADQQLIVETHSDHLMDRVRIDVRDGRGNLSPNDVSVLFFERDDLNVHIHSLRIDEDGNILDAPKNYRSFFLEETRRSLGI